MSLGMLAVLLITVDLGQLAEAMEGVAPGLLALAILAFLITNMASVTKWRLIIRSQGSDISWPRLTSIFYMGLFFNNFLPTNFGGDVVRVFKLSRESGSAVDAASSVVMDRATSTFALLLIAVVPALAELRILGTGVALAVISMFAASCVAVGVFASERAARNVGRLPVIRSDPMGIRRHLSNFYFSMLRFRSRGRTLASVMAISVIYQGLYVVTVNILALSLGIRLPVVYYFLFIPIVLAVGMIPFSLNGLGVREGAWVVLFTQAGVPAAQALSMSVLNFLVITGVSMAGGVFYLYDRSLPAAGPDEALGERE